MSLITHIIRLVDMLATRVKANVGNAPEDKNEMVILCGLALGSSPGYLTSSLQALTGAVLDAYSRGKQIQGLDQAIECLREGPKDVPVQFTPSPSLLRSCQPSRRSLPCSSCRHNYEETKVLLDPSLLPFPLGIHHVHTDTKPQH
jgi:hypothetical protein